MAVYHSQVHAQPLPRLFPPEEAVATALVSVCVVTRPIAWVQHLTGLGEAQYADTCCQRRRLPFPDCPGGPLAVRS